MDVPKYLCRVTRPFYETDKCGYILSHNWRRFPDKDPRALPLAHPDEAELIARFFAFPGKERTLYDDGFRILTIQSDSIENLVYKGTFQLSKGEYNGMLNKNLLDSDLLYRWVRTRDYAPVPEFLLEGWPGLIDTLGWGIVPAGANEVKQLSH